MIKKLMYKDFMLLTKSPAVLYSLIFMAFSTVLSYKIETMRYTGILFMIYITFISVTKYEDKYSGFLFMNTLPLKKTEIAKSKYCFSSIVLFGTAAIMYSFKIATAFSMNLLFEMIVVLFIGMIYITTIYNSYYKSGFNQVHTKLMIKAVIMNVICSITMTFISLIKVNTAAVIIGGVILLFHWHVGKELNMRSIEKVVI